MIRTYEDKRIYKNLKIVHVLSIISLVLSCVGIMTYMLNKYIGLSQTGVEFREIFFYLYSLLIPIGILNATKMKRKPMLIGESKWNNDFVNTLTIALIPFCGLVMVGLYLLGYMLLSHLFYIPNMILIRNCVLIKREWKKSPPAWYVEKETKKAEKQKEESERLLCLVGKRFFVKHYIQLKDWDEFDILDELRTKYGEETTRQRIETGKALFRKHLDEYALQIICGASEENVDIETKKSAEDILEKYYGNTPKE